MSVLGIYIALTGSISSALAMFELFFLVASLYLHPLEIFDVPTYWNGMRLSGGGDDIATYTLFGI